HLVETVDPDRREVVAQRAEVAPRVRVQALVDVALDDLPLELEGLLRKLEQVVELGEQALLVTGEAEAQARAIDRHDAERAGLLGRAEDRKSTRLNSSHVKISYAVFCLKKK